MNFIEKKNFKSVLNQNGFSLIELLIVIVVLGVLTAIAIPSFNQMVQNNRMISKSNDLLAGLNIARQAAVARGATVIMCHSDNADTNSPSCSGDWDTGFLVYAKPATRIIGVSDTDQTYDSANDEIIYQTNLSNSNGYSVTTTGGIDDFIRFDNQGLQFSNTLTSLTLCDVRVGNFGRTIQIAAAGRARSAVQNCP